MIRMVTTLLICSMVPLIHAADIKIVTPNSAFEDQDGNGSVGDSTSPFRSQFLHLANEFDPLPTGYDTLIGYALRLDGAATEPVVNTWEHLQITLATTQQTSLSMDFESNYGSDPVVVYKGPAVDNYEVSETGSTNPFWNPPFLFQTPFKYNPRIDGNLIIEFASTSGGSSEPEFDVEFTTGPVTAVSGNSPTGSVATNSASGTVITAYFFVPEPSTVALAVLAFVGPLLWRCGRC